MKAILKHHGAVIGNLGHDSIWADIEKWFKSRHTHAAYLTDIKRIDGGCNYTKPGTYEVTYIDGHRCESNEVIELKA